MCEPTTIIMLGVAVAGAAASIQQQNAAVKTANKNLAREEKSQQVAAVANYDQLEVRRQQEETAAGQAEGANAVEALKARGTAITAAGEAGVSGNSVDTLMRDLFGQEAAYRDSVAQNFANTNFEIDHQKDNIHRGAVNGINSMPSAPKVDYLGAAAKAGGGIYGAYQNHLKVTG